MLLRTESNYKVFLTYNFLDGHNIRGVVINDVGVCIGTEIWNINSGKVKGKALEPLMPFGKTFDIVGYWNGQPELTSTINLDEGLDKNTSEETTMTTEVNKILSEVKAGFNEHKKQVLEETGREVLDEVIAEIKKRCANGYNTIAFKLYDEGKANKVKFLLEQLGFICEIIKRSDEDDRYYGAPDGCDFVHNLWVDNYGCGSRGTVFYLKVEWSFDYE